MSKEKPMAEMPVMKEDEGVFLFYPNVPEEAVAEVTKVLHSRWIGQGPRVAEFETEFTNRFGGEGHSLAVGPDSQQFPFSNHFAVPARAAYLACSSLSSDTRTMSAKTNSNAMNRDHAAAFGSPGFGR